MVTQNVAAPTSKTEVETAIGRILIAGKQLNLIQKNTLPGVVYSLQLFLVRKFELCKGNLFINGYVPYGQSKLKSIQPKMIFSHRINEMSVEGQKPKPRKIQFFNEITQGNDQIITKLKVYFLNLFNFLMLRHFRVSSSSLVPVITGKVY